MNFVEIQGEIYNLDHVWKIRKDSICPDTIKREIYPVIHFYLVSNEFKLIKETIYFDPGKEIERDKILDWISKTYVSAPPVE